MNIIRSGSQPSRKGPDSWFTGDVRIDAPFQASEPAKVGGATVTFEPGARTAWHTHPLGQTLIVTQGRGWLQEWGKEAQALNQGDIAWIPPGLSTGTAPAAILQWRILRLPKPKTAARSPGWKK